MLINFNGIGGDKGHGIIVLFMRFHIFRRKRLRQGLSKEDIVSSFEFVKSSLVIILEGKRSICLFDLFIELFTKILMSCELESSDEVIEHWLIVLFKDVLDHIALGKMAIGLECFLVSP
jgi:hypothetical protein